jgi:restriction system protein
LVGGTGDGGVDGVIDEDILGLDRIYVQAKRYAEGNNVGASAIREFFGSLDIFKASKGLFVTTSTHTDAARRWRRAPMQAKAFARDWMTRKTEGFGGLK